MGFVPMFWSKGGADADASDTGAPAVKMTCLPVRYCRGPQMVLVAGLLLLGCGLLTPAAAEALSGQGAPDRERMTAGPPYFGFSVAGGGDLNGDGFDDVVVGAWGDDTVHAYFGSASGPSEIADWSASGQAGSHFGRSIAIAGDVDGDGHDDLIVGAPSHVTELERVGRVVVFLGSTDGPASTPVWWGESDQVDSNYGGSVGGAGDVNGDGYHDVIVGASSYDGGQMNEGRVFVYHGSALGPVSSYSWDHGGSSQDQLLGRAVAGAGDVNDDTYADVIVGADGEILVFFGSVDGLGTTRVSRTESADGFGSAVSGAGDVNGDGYDDVIAGAGEASKAFAYYGPQLGSQDADWTAQEDGFFGDSVSRAGDIDGDGYDDVLVGAPYYPFGDSGRVFAFKGAPGGLVATPGWVIANTEQWLKFGVSVAAIGDVDRDTFDDVIVGTDPSTAGGGFSTQERADVFYGSPQGLPGQAGWTVYGFPPQPAGTVGDTLRIRKWPTGTNVVLHWGGHQCGAGVEYQIYEGRLGSYSSHIPRTCNSFVFPGDGYILSPSPESSYFLVVVHDGPREGSYGTDSLGNERPSSRSACRPREIGECP